MGSKDKKADAEERAALQREQHDPATVFAELGLIGPPMTLVDAVDDEGYSVHAAPVAKGLVAIATVHTPGHDGAIRSISYLHLEPAVLIMLAALVPAGEWEHEGAEIIELHPSLTSAVDAATITATEHEGITFQTGERINAPCGRPDCPFRIELLPDLGEWVHVPNADGLAPTHAAVPPAPEALAALQAPADDVDGAQADA